MGERLKLGPDQKSGEIFETNDPENPDFDTSFDMFSSSKSKDDGTFYHLAQNVFIQRKTNRYQIIEILFSSCIANILFLCACGEGDWSIKMKFRNVMKNWKMQSPWKGCIGLYTFFLRRSQFVKHIRVYGTWEWQYTVSGLVAFPVEKCLSSKSVQPQLKKWMRGATRETHVCTWYP